MSLLASDGVGGRADRTGARPGPGATIARKGRGSALAAPLALGLLERQHAQLEAVHPAPVRSSVTARRSNFWSSSRTPSATTWMSRSGRRVDRRPRISSRSRPSRSAASAMPRGGGGLDLPRDSGVERADLFAEAGIDGLDLAREPGVERADLFAEAGVDGLDLAREPGVERGSLLGGRRRWPGCPSPARCGVARPFPEARRSDPDPWRHSERIGEPCQLCTNGYAVPPAVARGDGVDQTTMVRFTRRARSPPR
jgi:hypothetical protein